MRICYSNPTLLMKRPIAQIATKLSEEHEVTVLTPRKIFENRDKNLHYSDLDNVNVVDYPTASPPIQWDWPIPGLGFLRNLWKQLRDNDVFHMWVPTYKSHFLAAFMKKCFFPDTKLILTMDTIPGYSFSMGRVTDSLMKMFYKTFGRMIFSAANTITLYGESMKEYAEEAGLPMEKVKVVPTGIDIKKKKKDKDVRNELGIKKDEKMALFVGLLLPRKGIDIILGVAEILPKVKFVLVGNGPGRKEYEENAGENVVFTGFRKDVHNFYQQADMMLFPSRGEGLAGVIMEAMVYGLPIITSRIPCTTDLIKDRENGYLCPIEEEACYADKIKNMSKKEGKKLAKKAKERIKDYEWEKRLEEWRKLYK